MWDSAVEFFDANAWVGYVFFVVFATLAARYVVKLLLDRLQRQLERTRNLWDDALLEAARRPLGWAIWILGILW
ncbi:MAG: mechanosensitive ion channel family protein, partial [Gammaproteobacteria bacterium]|nr:mechanosensitive ion channel family protein [Gammaproteobacteria bacterium]